MFNPATDRCPKHPRYQGKRATGRQCWHCLRIWRYNERIRLETDYRDLHCLSPLTAIEMALIAEEEAARLPPPSWAFSDLDTAGVDVHTGHGDPVVSKELMFLEANPGAAEVADVGELNIPDENDGLHLVTYCSETGKPYGNSFVCPWSHASGRRLPRAVVAHRDHLDCAVQCQVRITQDGRWYNLLTDCPVSQ